MQMPSHIGNQQHCVNAVCYFGDKGINPLNQKGERLNDFFHLGQRSFCNCLEEREKDSHFHSF